MRAAEGFGEKYTASLSRNSRLALVTAPMLELFSKAPFLTAVKRETCLGFAVCGVLGAHQPRSVRCRSFRSKSRMSMIDRARCVTPGYKVITSHAQTL